MAKNRLHRLLAFTTTLIGVLVVTASTAWACGGLVAPNGAVQLLRTSTLVAYVDGYEHYVTNFEFSGSTESFGSIVPLPGEPSKVERGGRWTLQRLQQEVAPFDELEAFTTADSGRDEAGGVEIIEQKRIGSLDITIVKGGGTEVAEWADEQGFELSPDAPEVFDFYSDRSPYFMAARFDAEAAADADFASGDGIPVHLTIPVENPWVPVSILALGKPATEFVQADIFVLTEDEPGLLAGPGLELERSEPAGDLLLDDLRDDRGMGWVPDQAWLSYLTVGTDAGELTTDLAIDVHGNPPSSAAAGVVFSPAGPGVPAVSLDGRVASNRIPAASTGGALGAGWLFAIAATGAVAVLAAVGSYRAGARGRVSPQPAR